MRTFLNTTAKGTLSLIVLVILTVNSNASTSSASRLYKGERIGLFELPEIEIVSTKLPVKESSTLPSPVNITKPVAGINLPEIEITASRYQNNEQEFEIPVFLPVKFELENSNSERNNYTFKSENAQVKSTDETTKASEFKKRPRISFIANKILSAGMDFLIKVKDGLFFKS
ncbi:MAG: hypothetical protein ABI772_00160 [Bacteroidota bacterium]